MQVNTNELAFELILEDVAVMYLEKYDSWILRTQKNGSSHKGFFLHTDRPDGDHKKYNWSGSWVEDFEVKLEIPDDIKKLVFGLREHLNYPKFDEILESLPLDYEYLRINKEGRYLTLGSDSLIFFDEIIHFVNNQLILDRINVQITSTKSHLVIEALIEDKSQKNVTVIS